MISYKKINTIANKKLRNRKISLMCIIKTFFLYTAKGSTHQSITSKINMDSAYSISRQALIKKQENIPIQFFANILQIIVNENNKLNKLDTVIAVDGTYNNRHDGKVMSNLGLFDINNDIPIDLKFTGAKRNNEVKVITKYIKRHLKMFKNIIIVCDRGYYSFEFINFLIENDIRYIIRTKKQGDTLNPDKEIKKNINKYKIIQNIRKTSRIVQSKSVRKKRVATSRKKSVLIQIKSDCTIVTNLNASKYSDNDINNLYNKRWDIEVFFKLIKYNFKFQYMTEKNSNKYKRMYLCELILIYLEKIIEKEYMKDINEVPSISKRNGKNVKCSVKINKSNVIKGLLDTNILNDIFNGTLNESKLNKFKKAYIKIKKNELGRSFPRQAKKPFYKWYLKGYSESSQYSKIVSALINDTVNKLNKNLKMVAKRITQIGTKKYN